MENWARQVGMTGCAWPAARGSILIAVEVMDLLALRMDMELF